MSEQGEVLDAAFEMASADVLTAWRVRNAALAVAASFVHPGPDGEDYLIRRRMVEEWVSEGHDQVAEEDRQRLVAIQRMIAAEDERDEAVRLLRLMQADGYVPGEPRRKITAFLTTINKEAGT